MGLLADAKIARQQSQQSKINPSIQTTS